MNIHIAADHRGFRCKEVLVAYMRQGSYNVHDHGPAELDPNDDYPLVAQTLVRATLADPGSLGILLCGSGEGIAMAANKLRGVRAAVCWNEAVARMARRHNDANILVLPADFVSTDTAEAILAAFIGSAEEKRISISSVLRTRWTLRRSAKA